jgi:uncharacterized protein (TIGR02147 family)
MKPVSILDYDEYRPFLKDLLEEKNNNRMGLSLRGLARLAGMSPSHLSRALNGQKKLSATSAHRLSVALNQTPEESDRLLSLIELEKTADSQRRSKILKRMSRLSPTLSSTVSLDVFRVIADWYYFALVALTNTRGFRGDSYWIARRLRIKPFEARMALDRLVSLGLIKKTGRSYKAVNDADISTTDDLSSAAIKENHSQHLSMALRAMHEVPIELREFNNITLAMNPADVPKAKKMIREFVDRFDQEFKRQPAEEIFQLNLQFYLLSKPERETQ